MTPLISVILPVYNAEKFIKDAIDSILNQTYKNFELIIINDGSTDNSESIILGYDDKRIIYVKNERNIKLINTLNKGIKLAKGDFIARMDADDISLPNRFEEQINIFKNFKNVGVCGSNIKIFSNNTNKSYLHKFPISNINIKSSILTINPFAHPSVMIRKSILDEYDIKYNNCFYRVEDWGLWISLIDKCDFYNVSKPLLLYRYVETSESRLNVKDNNHLNIRIQLLSSYFDNFKISLNNKELYIISSLTNNDHLSHLPKKDIEEGLEIIKKHLPTLNKKYKNTESFLLAKLLRSSKRRMSILPLIVMSFSIKSILKSLKFVFYV